MRAKDRETYLEATGRGLEFMLQRLAQPRFFLPWIGPGWDHSYLRRTVARLRAGAIVPDDPRVDPLLLADLIEEAIIQDQIIRSIGVSIRATEKVCRPIREKEEVASRKRAVASFHRLKKSLRTAGPDSPLAERFRRLHRLRRSRLGRRRKKK